MGAVTTDEELAVAIAARSQLFSFRKNWAAFTVAAGQFHSSWLAAGFPGPGVAPGAAAVPTQATAGALAKFTDPSGGNFAHLVSVDANFATSVATLELWDRLSHTSGLSGLSILSQTTNLPTAAITRGDTTGVGTEWFLENYVATGAVPATATITYTNHAGVGSHTTTVAIPANWAASRLLHIGTLQAGDLWIKSIESVQLNVSTLTAGDFGVTAARPICVVCTREQGVTEIETLLDMLQRVETGACLWLTAYSSTGSIGACRGGLQLITSG